MLGSGRVRACDFELGTGSGFKTRPIYNSGESVIYLGNLRAIFAFGSKNVGSRRVAGHLLRKKSNVKKSHTGQNAKLLNNMTFKILCCRTV